MNEREDTVGLSPKMHSSSEGQFCIEVQPELGDGILIEATWSVLPLVQNSFGRIVMPEIFDDPSKICFQTQDPEQQVELDWS